MIHVSPAIVLKEEELHEEFVRASGPGGQNVNKVSTAVQLYFDARRSPSLPGAVRERLLRLAGRRASSFRAHGRPRFAFTRGMHRATGSAANPATPRGAQRVHGNDQVVGAGLIGGSRPDRLSPDRLWRLEGF